MSKDVTLYKVEINKEELGWFDRLENPLEYILRDRTEVKPMRDR